MNGATLNLTCGHRRYARNDVNGYDNFPEALEPFQGALRMPTYFNGPAVQSLSNSRLAEQTYTNQMQLLTQRSTDLRWPQLFEPGPLGDIPYTTIYWQDYVEVPVGSNRWYRVWWNDIAQGGYPTEFRVCWLTQQLIVPRPNNSAPYAMWWDIPLPPVTPEVG